MRPRCWVFRAGPSTTGFATGVFRPFGPPADRSACYSTRCRSFGARRPRSAPAGRRSSPTLGNANPGTPGAGDGHDTVTTAHLLAATLYLTNCADDLRDPVRCGPGGRPAPRP